MTTARIGLIAVSGVRVHNERLQRLGVTLPGFVERARVIASMPSLGLLTLADVSLADDPELLDLLAGSGRRQVLIGFESPRAPPTPVTCLAGCLGKWA